MDEELRQQIEDELSKTLYDYIPFEILTNENLDILLHYIYDNYKSFPHYLIGACIDYIKFIELNLIFVSDTNYRLSYFNGYFAAHNRMGNEIAFGANLDEYREFLHDESYMAY